MSKVQCLRTIRIAERPNLIWVEIETDEGLIGLGESFHGAEAVEAVIHEQIAAWLIGRDSYRIDTDRIVVGEPNPAESGTNRTR